MNTRTLRRAVAGGAAAAGAGIVGYALLIRPWHLRWGVTDDELLEVLPGDELVPRPRLSATHAVTIRAPAAAVWPWIVQIGQGRGGFYSYSWLENLVGCRIRNADRILSAFQDLKVGDKIQLHPKAPPLAVTRLEPGRALVLGESWAFVLKEIDPHTTRFIVRGRGDYTPGPLTSLCWRGIFEPAHFVMERKMMLTIKRLAESASASTPAHGPQEPRGEGASKVLIPAEALS